MKARSTFLAAASALAALVGACTDGSSNKQRQSPAAAPVTPATTATPAGTTVGDDSVWQSSGDNGTSGPPASTSDASTTGVPTSGWPGAPVDTTPDCDPAKEYHKLQFPAEIDTCLRSGKLWNFDYNECGRLNAAYEEFHCADFEGVKSELTDRGLTTGRLDSEKAAGGKLVGCGVSNNGDIVVAQVYRRASTAPANDCLYNPNAGRVVSLCFRVYTADEPPPPISGELAEREFTRSCLNAE